MLKKNYLCCFKNNLNLKNLLLVKRFIATYLFFSLILVNQCFTQNSNANVRLRAQVTYPNQTLANICGYSKQGREYALVGANLGMIIVDITNPDTPRTLKQISGVNNQWKEIKVYKNFAYVTSEGGTGLQIINLANLPDTALSVRQYTGDSIIAGRLGKIHALHIDTLRGFMYLYGTTGIANGGAIVLNLEPDPYNPKYAGQYSTNYIHDGYVYNDTLWGGHINAGYFSIIDFRNKSTPIVLNTQPTINTFTHNTWLTDDRRTLLTTDETANSYLAAYDVSTPTNIRFLDKIQSNTGSGSIVHNTHVKNDYAITSWYKDGFTITDVHRPQNLIQVGDYDCYPQGAGNGFAGTWGVFPFFASGTIVASNIEGVMYVLSPQYKRACYLEGFVLDSVSRSPISGVSVKINTTDPDKRAKSNARGAFYTGQVTPGNVTATFTMAGYYPKTIPVSLTSGVVNTQTVELVKKQSVTVSGKSVKADFFGNLSNMGMPSKLKLLGTEANYEITSDSLGNFVLKDVLIGSYQVFAGAWGYKHKVLNINVNANTPNLTIGLQAGYQDDFWGDFGWTVQSTAPRGMWVRGVPVATWNGADICNPGNDHPADMGDMCYMTGNGGSTAGFDDLDDGYTLLTSPLIHCENYRAPELRFSYWFYDAAGTGTPNDTLNATISLLINGLWRDTVVRTIRTSASAWQSSGKITLSPLRPTQVRVAFRVADAVPGHVVEAAIDSFSFYDALANGVSEADANIVLKAYPNPFSTSLNMDYQFVESFKDAHLILYDVLGKAVWSQPILNSTGTLHCETPLSAGVYMAQVTVDGRVSRSIKIVKTQ
jgi:choice-of-anchor B domain-containing protein